MADLDVIEPIPRLDPIVAIGKDELVEGGLEGAANRPVIALANQVAYVMERTYSKTDVDDLAADLQEMIAAAEKGLLFFETQTQLLASSQGEENRAAQARDTGKIYLWKIKSAVGVTPVVWGWVDTGESDLEKAKREIVKGVNNVAGMFFYDPYYEKAENGDLYVKLKAYPGSNGCFYIRNANLPTRTIVFNDVVATLSEYFTPNNYPIKSPLGVDGCFKLANADAIVFNHETDRIEGVNRATLSANTNVTFLIHRDGTQIGPCVERDIILSQQVALKQQRGENLLAQCWFFNPYYEVASNALYFKPTAGTADRTLYFSDRRYGTFQVTNTELINQLSSIFPAEQVNVTSPAGVTGCFKFISDDTLNFNPVTKVFSKSLLPSDKMAIPLISWNYTDVRRCTEEPKIREAISKATAQSFINTISQNLDNFELATVITNSGGGHISTMPANLATNNYGSIVFDTETNILYIPQGVCIFGRGVLVPIATALGFAVDCSTVIAQTSLVKVYFDKVEKTFLVKRFDTALTATEKTNLLLFCIIRITGTVFEITSTFDYKVDFARNGEEISNERAAFIPSLENSESVISYNSQTSVLTIPRDYLIRYKQKVLSLPATDISFKEIGTSASRLYFDLYTNTFVSKLWSVNLTVKEKFRYIYVCGIRDRGYTNDQKATSLVQIDLTCPYKVDGYLYGIVASDTVQNTLDDTVKAIAHRGASIAAPENTLPAYVLAKQLGFSYVECDICYTADNVAVLLHDDTLDRTTNGTGKITEVTAAYVATLDAGSWKNAKYTGTKVPTLREFLQLCRNLNLHPYLEIKGSLNATTERLQETINMVSAMNLRGRVTYIGGLADMMKIKNIDASARLGFVMGDPSLALIDSAVTLKTESNEVFIDCLPTNLTDEMVEYATTKGVFVETWTTNTAALVRPQADIGVSGITTDLLNIRQILNESYS